MSGFYLYDDSVARGFEPFALSRPVGELRAGALLIRERWERALGIPCAGFLGAPHLADFDEEGAPGAAPAGKLPMGAVVVNARFAPVLTPALAVDVWRSTTRVAALRIMRAIKAEEFSDDVRPLDSLFMPTARMGDVEGWWMDAPWDLVRHLPDMLARDIEALSAEVPSVAPDGVTVLGEHPVTIEPGATVEPMVLIDATAGPVLIRTGARVAAFSRLVGPLYVAAHAQVAGGKVACSAVGEHSRVHGEISNAIFVGYANKGHDGFLGHSVLGRWVNLGASTVTSNLKNTYGPVQLWTPDGVKDTGLQFLGTLFGDHAKTAIGTRLTTGCVVGTGANVVGSGLTPKVIAPFSWGEGDALYDVAKFALVAERMMTRRGVTLGDRGRLHLARVFAARWRTSA
ncbi:MAG: putative sugar nucleotidyl transferase [Gemmatimonadaceae bacterium]